jgi:hypothetical protein
VLVAGFALLVAALGVAVGRLPADACAALVRGLVPQAPASGLLIDWMRCAAVLGAGTAAAAMVVVLAVPGWSWGAAATAVAVGLLPLAAAPVTAAPLLGAPLRLGLWAWCAVRVLDQMDTTPATVAAVLAGSVAAATVSVTLGRRGLVEAIRQSVRDSVSVLVASPLVVAVGGVPLLVGLPLAPWELWRYCQRCYPAPAPPPARDGPPKLFVVYLDGVGKTRRAPTRVAGELVRALGMALPGARFVTDVLPYSPQQVPLTERPGAGPVWRWLHQHAFPMLVGHNILQTLVACDARYQQGYGHALAQAMTAALHRAGHRAGDQVAVLGYSGGAVVGVAAADPLADLIGGPAPVVISLGGYLDGNRTPQHATVHHVTSSADRLERLGQAMFPARWPVASRSAWHRALADERVVRHSVTGPRHVGPHGYLAVAKDPDGTSNLVRTVAVAARLLHPGQRQ